jgi:hypothetical protein
MSDLYKNICDSKNINNPDKFAQYIANEKQKFDKYLNDLNEKHNKIKILIKLKNNNIWNKVCKNIKLNDNILKHIQLRTLDVTGNKVTDEGIKHMNLFSLYANKYNKISDK